MLDFDFTDEQRLLEQAAREWAGREVAPRIRDLDRAHRFDRGILPQMASLGLLGVCIPTEYGGAGMDYVSLGLASEELEYVDTSLRVILSVHLGLNSLSLLAWGTEAQKRRYLVPQAQGEKIATYGLTEPSAGSDARGIQTVAIRRGDRYVLSGEKTWISRLRVDRPREEEGARSIGDERVHRRARLHRLLERNVDREVGHPCRQHRFLQDGRGRGAGGEPARTGG
jgi:glutaryl-CoA dehydrogenase (non-decarboxylating)